jgi:hypothetical protein
MWKCRPVESLEIQRQDFHPSPHPWKSLRDSHIPTRTTIPLIICGETQDQNLRKVLPMFPDRSVTYVPGRTSNQRKHHVDPTRSQSTN